MIRAGILAAVSLSLTATAACAQSTVICANCFGENTAIIDEIKTVASWAQQAQQMQQQWQQLVQTYDSLAHLNPRTLLTGQALLNDATRLPGSAASAIPGLNFGQTLSAPGTPFYTQNHVYTPQGNDWNAQEMQRQEYATANLQGEAQTGMATAAQRLAALVQLENSIPSQPDVQATAAMNARIDAEKMYLANETTNVQRLQMLLHTQQAVDQQRAEQNGRQQAEQWNAAAAAQAWGN
jgi:hypothetical protein